MKWFIVSMLMVFSISVAFSQAELIRNYANQKVNNRLRQENASLANQQSSVEHFIEEQKKKLQFKRVTFPVVFHLI